jgi:hypothetical protein
MMPISDKLISARESRGSPPVGSACWPKKSAPSELSLNLHFKGFGGGVPLNTERAAVKPRVGTE